MSEKKSITFKRPFVTESGFSIAEPTVAYQTWGSLNQARDNAVVVCHALTGNTQADKWFGGFFGEGKTLDSARQFIICANVIGGCYGSSGPTSINPSTGKPYQIDFPQVTVRDIVRFQQQLLDELGIEEIEFVIGGSLGGMQALEFCIMDDRPRAAICIAMGKAHRPWQIGISHTQRQAIYNDPHWQGGYYAEDHPPAAALATARMIAMNSYRSAQDFDAKFGRDIEEKSNAFQVESYLNYQGQKLAQRFDAVSYVRLTQAMDSHDVARGRSNYEMVLNNVHQPVQLIGFDSDGLYPPNEQKELAELLPNGTYAEIASPHGHDAFLIEFDKMQAVIAPFLTRAKTFN